MVLIREAAAIVADALGRELEEIALAKRLIDDLGAESIDFLDIIYRLERAFRIRIRAARSRRRRAAGSRSRNSSRRAWTVAGAALACASFFEARFRRAIPARWKVADIPLLFTIETFCRIVVRARRA